LYLHEQLLLDKLLKTYWHGFHNVDVLILLDTCYAYGYIKKFSLPLSAISKSIKFDHEDPFIIECKKLLDSKLEDGSFIELLNKDPDVNYFFACEGENEQAYGDIIPESEFGNSYFTYAMLKHFPKHNTYDNYYRLFKKITETTNELSNGNQTPNKYLIVIFIQKKHFNNL